MRKFLILTDGKAGHENQSKALARALGGEFGLCEVHFKSRFHKLLSYLLDRLGVRTLSLFAFADPGVVRSTEFSLVIGAGSGTFYAVKALAKRLGVKGAVILYPRGYHLASFDCILAPSFDRPKPAPNVVEIPANLVAADARFYESGVQSFLERAAAVPEIGVIIGGPNKCSTMSVEWMKRELDAIFARPGTRGVTTSRRTPPEVERLVDGYPWDYKLIYSRDHFNPIPAFVSRSRELFVTAESTGMLSEACTSGSAAVHALDNLKPGGHKFRRFVDGLRAGGYLDGKRKIDLTQEFARVAKLVLSLAVALVLGAATADEPAAAKTDGELWNEGVEFYEAGDVTNALRVLKPLMLSKSHGARAAEVVAKLEYDRGSIEESAAAAQLALREDPKDARRNRNFTRAVDRLPQLRKEARIKASMEKVGKDPVGTLVTSTESARRLMKDATGFLTNRAEKAVAESDRLSAAADALSLVWPGLREVIAQSITNQDDAVTILAQLDTAEAKTLEAKRRFGDMDDRAYSSIAEAELDFNRFTKLVLGGVPQGAPTALGLDFVCQSNAYLDVEKVNDRPWQNEALDYTRIFRAVFPSFARDYEQRAQSDTNLPPFKAEDQAKISELSTELEKVQLELVEKPLPPEMEKACALIAEIRKLMPPEKGQGGGQPQPQPQANQQQKQNQQQNQQQDQQQKQDQRQDQRQNEEPQDAEPQDEQEKESEAEEPKDEQPPEDKEVEAILKKAQERNDEHEAEKRARMRKAPLPPNERDW